MSKYKYLILILMFAKSFYYSEARCFTNNIFKMNETIEEYKNRMISLRLPFLGQTYSNYEAFYKYFDIIEKDLIKKNITKESDNNRNSNKEEGQTYLNYEEFCKHFGSSGNTDMYLISKEDYQLLMKYLIKKIITKESDNNRNSNKREGSSVDTNTHIISKEDYQIFMESLPRINESMESVNNRNSKKEIELSIYTNEEYQLLQLRYPKLYETFLEYHDRMKKIISVDKILSPEMFGCLKWYWPNIGEIYEEYFEYREKEFGIKGYSELEFDNALKSYPRLYENALEFYSVFHNKNTYMPKSINDLSTDFKDNYLGLLSLYPIFAETYDEYLTRMQFKHLVPIKLESFILYQAYYPNLCVQYNTFKEMMLKLYETNSRILNLSLVLYTEETFYLLKEKFPLPFESQVSFDNRWKDSDYHKVYDRYFAKRMYPKMSETYTDYENRILKIFFPETASENNNLNPMTDYLKPISHQYFKIYKKNYPQLGYKIEEIYIKKKKEPGEVEDDEDNVKITFDTFRLIIKKLPGVYENYTFYKHRMFILDTNPIDEEEFDDLKKIYIRLCETFKDYEHRMNTLEIVSVNSELIYKFKITIPPIYERRCMEYYEYVQEKYDYVKNPFIDGLRNYNRLFFIENPESINPSKDEINSYRRDMYEEKVYDMQHAKVFNFIRYMLFRLVYPSAFENYEKYKKRINKLQEVFDFKDLEKLKPYERVIFKTFIIPLTNEEFMDIKLRYIKLSETPKEYGERMNTYDIDNIHDNINNYMFKIIKHAQVQLYDNFETYKKRYQRIAINERGFLTKLSIPELSIVDFELFKKYLPNKPFESNYSNYIIDMKKNIKNEQDYNDFMENILDKHDYYDYMKTFPKYYDLLTEYNQLNDERCLPPASIEYLKMFKKVYPHLLDNSFIEYKQRSTEIFGLKLMEEDDFNTFKLHTPKQFETITAYKKRLPDASTELYDNGDDKLFKRIYPKICSTLLEYTTLMELMGISKIYKTYNMHRTQLFFMKLEEYRLWKKRIPKITERYSSYKNRMKDLEPLDESEFYDTIKLYSFACEKFNDYKDRLNSYMYSFANNTFEEDKTPLNSYKFIPLTMDIFKEQKNFQVLIGETYQEYVIRIENLIYEFTIKKDSNSQSQINSLINNYDLETPSVENFVQHVLNYPFNYDSYEQFCLRQNEYEFISDPQVKTQNWYKVMKSLLPKINENITNYRERVKTYNLGFPEITEKQFYRHLYALPNPAESYETFFSRIQYSTSSNEINTIPIPQLNIKDFQIMTPSKSCRTQFNSISPYTTFTMCDKISEHLSKCQKDIYSNFIALLPNIVIDYSAYHKNEKKYFLDPLTEEEFNVFKKYFSKLLESISDFNKNIKSMGFTEINDDAFSKFKIFYPRIHHISYDDYVLDIEVKFATEKDTYRNLINALKLSSYEFDTYKRKFPKLFEFSYETYQNRMEKDGITEVFTKYEFDKIREANFPLPNYDYKQYEKKMNSLALDPIPYDVFSFFKGIYPGLFEKRYAYRIENKVYKELKMTNYNEDKYKFVKNNIISEIIKRNIPYRVLQDKIDHFMSQIMTLKELNQFLQYFGSYSQFIQSKDKSKLMDEETYKLFKKAYYISIDETYEEYETRMKSLNLITIPRNIIRFFKSTYPHLTNSHKSYETDSKFYETIELRNIQVYVLEIISNLGYKRFVEEDYNFFQNNFPRIFDSRDIFNVSFRNKSQQISKTIFDHDEFDSIKTSYFPRLAENYDTYKARMINLGLWVLDRKSFTSFKAVYPNPVISLPENYSKYKQNFQHIVAENNPSIGIRHIMTEEEFKNELQQDFPKLFETWDDFYDRRKNLNYATNRLINDNQNFSKNLFNDMKIVYHPTLGQHKNVFLTFIKSLQLFEDTEFWTTYFKNVINLYPIFFESFDRYKERLKESPIEYLKLNENWFNKLFQIFPFPYESYLQYKKRNSNETFILSEVEFNYFRRVFPLISENYDQYKNRLMNNLCIDFVVSNKMFMIFKSLFPQIDETYECYKKRFDNNLINSDEETKKQLLFFVESMKTSGDTDIAAETSKGTNTTAETSGDTVIAAETSKSTNTTAETSDDKDIAAETSKDTNTTAETSGDTDIIAEKPKVITVTKSYGAMTYEEFKLFKLSLPIPMELHEDYIIRINKLASTENLDRTVPEILPPELYEDLIKSYPKYLNNDYSTYCKNMESMNNTVMSINTFNEMVTVAKNMQKNPYTFNHKSFYKLVVTE